MVYSQLSLATELPGNHRWRRRAAAAAAGRTCRRAGRRRSTAGGACRARLPCRGVAAGARGGRPRWLSCRHSSALVCSTRMVPYRLHGMRAMLAELGVGPFPSLGYRLQTAGTSAGRERGRLTRQSLQRRPAHMGRDRAPGTPAAGGERDHNKCRS